MKIGIISQFNNHTVNYGNHLQAYALNLYLRKYLGVDCVHSLILHPKTLWKHTGVFTPAFFKKLVQGIKRRAMRGNNDSDLIDALLSIRLKCFEEFRKQHIPMPQSTMTTKMLLQSDYDAIIVGSDVVWAQTELGINRTAFLDFGTKKPYKRISYAPSFARDYIPKENIRLLRRYLSKFDAISVRECSSVSMLNNIGVRNVKCCLDPTLLLPLQEWKRLEVRPSELQIDDAYVFVYMLGKEQAHRDVIRKYAEHHCLKIVTVPHADGTFNEIDANFGDVMLMDCSIENWLWLIHHASIVITDSFHGLVFSTIFEKKFLVFRRHFQIDINNRIRDYLEQINQLDKAVTEQELLDFSERTWDYEKIREAITVRREASVEFLNVSVGEICA